MAALDDFAIAGRETRHEPAACQPRHGRGEIDWNDLRVFLAVARGARCALPGVRSG
jgi:hypothetical protein